MDDRPEEGGSSARFEQLVRALSADLDTVLSALDEQRREQLASLLAEASDRPARQVLLALQELLLWADLPDEHPVSQALASDRLVAPPGVARGMSEEGLVALLLGALPREPGPTAGDPGPGWAPGLPDTGRREPPAEHGSYRAVLDRLAGVATWERQEARLAGADPDLPDLIRLRTRGAIRLPRFQFDASGAAQSVVLEVNRVLGAEHDPWGVVSWWTDLHAWLERAPVELLGEPGGADELSELAWAEVTD